MPTIGANDTIARLRRQQAALAAFGSFAFKETDLFAILNEAARICAQSLGVPFCKICRYRREENDLLIEAGCGWHPGVIGQVVSQADETSPQGRAFITRQPVIIHDLQHSNNLVLPEFYPHHGIVSTVDVIIAAQDGTPYGVLEIDSPTLHQYDEYDINFLTGFANVLAEAVFRTQKNKAQQDSQRLQAIGQLTGGIAHDFNNTLTVVINYLDVVKSRLPVEDGNQQIIDEALAAAQHGASLTQNLLSFARRQALRPVPIDVNQKIIQTASLLNRTLGRGIEVGLNLGPDIWPATIDPTYFQASLINLATNARDAMPNGGTITITTSNRRIHDSEPDISQGDYICIEIKDTGTGMAPKVLARIFDPFFTTKAQGKGTGLGLSIVFGFLKQSKGHIGAESELGKGTIFRMYFPRQIEI